MCDWWERVGRVWEWLEKVLVGFVIGDMIECVVREGV